MANEVTINIESSLAAMAFVVADQQEQIKVLREMNKEWEKMYHDEQSVSSTHEATIGALEDEIKELKDKLHESEQDAKNYKDNVDVLDDENIDLCKRIDNLKGKILEWHDFEAKPFSLKVSEHPMVPCVVLLTETTDDTTWDCDNHRLPIGTKQFVPVWASIKDGYYHLEYNCSGSKVIAWAMIDENNL